MIEFDDIHEPVTLDDYGTVRVSDKLGTVAVYVKVGDNSWRATYVDTISGENVLPRWDVSDAVAGFGVVVYTPKSVESHDR